MAQRYYHRAQKIRTKRGAPNDSRITVSLQNIGFLYLPNPYDEKRFELWQRSLWNESDIHGIRKGLKICKSSDDRDMRYRDEDRFQIALDYFTRSLGMQQQELLRVHLNIVNSLYDIGSVHAEQRDFDRSLVYYFVVLEI